MSVFTYQRHVAFSDTDAMGVVHHANYLRFCEEARVAWMRARQLTETHYPKTDIVLAVLHYQVWHLRPARFEDAIVIHLQVRRSGLKVHFQYVIYKGDERIAEAETLHIPVNAELRPARPNDRLAQVIDGENWSDGWLERKA